MRTCHIDLQIACNNKHTPSLEQFQQWANAALTADLSSSILEAPYELCIRIVDKKESQQLNTTYRKKDKPTNILSFPYEDEHTHEEDEESRQLLGDLAICASIVEKEAAEQNKLLEAHWAHMTIHGILHLLGFDHTNNEEAEIMESLEIETLNQLGFPNPYIN